MWSLERKKSLKKLSNMKATINLTDTMLNKSIIDANKSVCELAKEFSFDYSEHEAGGFFPTRTWYHAGILMEQ